MKLSESSDGCDVKDLSEVSTNEGRILNIMRCMMVLTVFISAMKINLCNLGVQLIYCRICMVLHS